MWLTSLGTMPSRSFHVASVGRVSSPWRLRDIPSCIHRIFFTHPQADTVVLSVPWLLQTMLQWTCWRGYFIWITGLPKSMGSSFRRFTWMPALHGGRGMGTLKLHFNPRSLQMRKIQWYLKGYLYLQVWGWDWETLVPSLLFFLMPPIASLTFESPLR